MPNRPDHAPLVMTAPTCPVCGAGVVRLNADSPWECWDCDLSWDAEGNPTY